MAINGVSFAFPNISAQEMPFKTQWEMIVIQTTAVIVCSYLDSCVGMAEIEKEIMTSQGSPGGTTGFASELPNIRAHLLRPGEMPDFVKKIRHELWSPF